jgi:primosomal protein N' (replication factor Y)
MAKLFAKILIPQKFDILFDYHFNDSEEYEIGDLVEVNFANKNITGCIFGISVDCEFSKTKPVLKNITKHFSLPPLDKKLLELIEWQADYTLGEKGKILSLCYSNKFFKEVKRHKKQHVTPNALKNTASLNDSQHSAYDDIKSRLNSFSVNYLDGVTGSGKTEVYLKLAEEVINSGKQILIMLPEILLSKQIIEKFTQRLGFEPVIWHSTISEAVKRRNFFKICNGEAKAVIGARSSLHLPYKKLGLIVVDEEHDSSYKQEEQIVYNARDIAVKRAEIEDITILLCSATPSIESWNNIKSGKYHYQKLESRYSEIELPEVTLIDMKNEGLNATEWISSKLRNEINETCEKGKQVILFLNRRGYAPLTLCDKCGHRLKSPDTSSWMVMHYAPNGEPYLECHHSGLKLRMPKECPECKAKDSFRACGPGVQRVKEECKKLFPELKTVEISSDLNEKESSKILEEIHSGEINIIIGTQILAKGHHFKNVNLVGIIDGDLGLDFEDLRAGEKSYQILNQVAGRAGREGEKGKVFIQTYNSEHKVMQALVNGKRDELLNIELEERKSAELPPFSRLVSILIYSKNKNAALASAKEVIRKLKSNENNEKSVAYGPSEALYFELRGYFRYNILIKARKNYNVQGYLRSSLGDLKLSSNVKIRYDIDPYSFG